MGLFGKGLPDYMEWSLNDRLAEPAWKSAVEATPGIEKAVYISADPKVGICHLGGAARSNLYEDDRGVILAITPLALSVAWATKKEIRVDIQPLEKAEWWVVETVNSSGICVAISFAGQDLLSPDHHFWQIEMSDPAELLVALSGLPGLAPN